MKLYIPSQNLKCYPQKSRSRCFIVLWFLSPRKILYSLSYYTFYSISVGGTCGKESTRQCRRYRRCRFNPWIGKTPPHWRKKWQPTPVFLPGESHGQRSLMGYSPQGRKESDANKHARAHTHTHTHTHTELIPFPNSLNRGQCL